MHLIRTSPALCAAVVLTTSLVSLSGCSLQHTVMDSPCISTIKLPAQHSSGLYSELLNEVQSGILDRSQEYADVLISWQQVNPDVRCMISVPELGILEPVIGGAKSNEQWLRTNIYGEKDRNGSVFFDYRCDAASSTIKMIHGHNMLDGTVFGRLPELLHLADCGEAPLIELIFAEGAAIYRVFSVMSVNTKEEALPLDPLLDFDGSLSVADDLLYRSDVPGGVLDSCDILILNTCWYGESGVERNLHCVVAACRAVGKGG